MDVHNEITKHRFGKRKFSASRVTVMMTTSRADGRLFSIEVYYYCDGVFSFAFLASDGEESLAKLETIKICSMISAKDSLSLSAIDGGFFAVVWRRVSPTPCLLGQQPASFPGLTGCSGCCCGGGTSWPGWR